MKMSSSRRNSLSKSKPGTEKDSFEHSSKVSDNNNNVASSVMNLPDAKWIQIYVNGDEHFSGCRCVVNSRYYRNLDMFLNYLTERLKPHFGAVRNIYTPINGHPIGKLDDLISKHKYVVAGNERFKKLEFGYTDITDKKLKRHTLRPKAKFKVSKAKTVCHNSLTAYFHQNGNFKVKPNKVSLLPQDLETWETIFQKIREVIKCGPIKRICSINGKPIQSIEELTNNQSYVIIGKHEVFKPGQYSTFLQNINSSSKERYRFRSSRKSSSVITGRSSGIYSQASARSSRLGFISSANKHNPVVLPQQPVVNNLNIDEPGNGVESLDSFIKPIEEKLSDEEITVGNKIKIDLDDDCSGIFRSKALNHLTVGAVEVEDSSETVVDLPVDLLDAEEVEDEITPDMERSFQQLSLDVPDEIVAYLPSMQNNAKTIQNSNERQVSTNKYNLSHSQTLDFRNVFV